jgi:hypothetical protein
VKQYYLDSLSTKKIASDEALLSKFPELAGRVMPLVKYQAKTPGCHECGWGRDMFTTLTNELQNNPSFLSKFLKEMGVAHVRFIKGGKMMLLPTPPKA